MFRHRSLQLRLRNYLNRLSREILAGVYEKVLFEAILLVVKLLVPSVEGDKLLVSSTFKYLPCLDDQDLIGTPDR